MKRLAAFLLIAGTVAAFPQVVPLTDSQKAGHLLDRFAYGPRPGDVERAERSGLNAWLEAQLRPDSLPEHVGGDPPEDPKHRPGREFLIRRKLLRDVQSDRQLQELMVDFWFNHFNVSSNKVNAYEVYRYERDVIRPHCLGHFRELLGAVAHSPAMLDYLDNARSRKATVDKNGNRVPGINENYARELMELHTMGVNGGYTQHDIEELARVLTGWTTKNDGDERVFTFDANRHDEDSKQILDVSIPAGGGEDEGERMLDVLSEHPSTAHFIAYKLCRFFIRDDPPAAAVDRVATTFRQTRGDIKAMIRTIFQSPEMWDPAAYRSKLKSPLFLVVSALRTLSATMRNPRELAETTTRMGMPLYQCEPPTGFAEREEAWLSAGNLLARLNFCTDLAENKVNGTQVRLEPLLTYVAGPNRDRSAMYQTTHSLLHLLVDGPVSNQTVLSLQTAVQDPNIDYPHLIGLILGSPEFQRR